MKRSESRRGMAATGKTREAAITFFDAIIERRFSDADKALNEVKARKNTNPEFREGYMRALEGMLFSAKSGDDRDFLNRASYDEESMDRYSRDFKDLIRRGINKPFDLGFFSAWSDLMHYRLNAKK